MEAYASGNWLVKAGKEADFIRKWEEWLQWSRDHVDGFRWAKLMRSGSDPRRFVSISEWESEKARGDWMGRAEFQEMLQGVRALTDEFMGGDYKLEAAV